MDDIQSRVMGMSSINQLLHTSAEKDYTRNMRLVFKRELIAEIAE
jgi:hypothetical protein